MNNRNPLELEYVKYDEAKALKELGFEDPCLFAFDRIQMRCSNLLTDEQKFNGVNYNSSGNYTSQPSYSQAFRFFRQKHDIDIHIYEYFGEQGFDFDTYSDSPEGETDRGNMPYDSYEEAELACLRALINDVKEKNEQRRTTSERT